MAEKAKCCEVRATVHRYMDPVSVVLNLWASQRIHERGDGPGREGSGFVTWAEVFPGVPLDADGQVKPDPPDYRREGDGSKPQNAPQRDDAGKLYESSPGKYGRQAPRWDWTAFSACEVVEWALSEFTGDREFMRSVLLKVHPNAGRYSLPNEKGDPFVACARRFLDDGAAARDAKDYARVVRSSYGAFRKVVWVAVGSKSSEDLRLAQAERAQYEEHRRQVNAEEGRKLSAALATSQVESAS